MEQSKSSVCLEIWVRCSHQTSQQLSSAVGTSAVDQLSCQKQVLLGLEGFLEPEKYGFDSKVKEVCRKAPALGFESIPKRLTFSQLKF